MGRSGAGGGPSRGGGGGGGRGSMGRSSSSGRSGMRSGLSHSSFREFSSFARRAYSPGYRPYRGMGYRPSFHGGSGGNSIISGVIAILTLVVILFAAVRSMGLGNGGSITASTVDREPLPVGSVIETEYYTDNLFWFGNDKALLDGMKDFYRQTGVQPYLYITDKVDGSRNPSATQQVVDTEAVNILLDYVDRYYYDTSLDESELFGRAFSKAADRMMSKTVNPLVYVAGAGVAIVVIVAGVYVFRKKQEQKKREDEQMERILNMDLNAGTTGASSEVEDLENKYITNSGGN